MELRWPTDRIDYVPITQRQPLPLPDGAKVIVWPCVNVEHWVISEPMPRTVVAPPGGLPCASLTSPTGPGTSMASGSASGGSRPSSMTLAWRAPWS